MSEYQERINLQNRAIAEGWQPTFDKHNTELAIAFERGLMRIWTIKGGWQVADLIKGAFWHHRPEPTLLAALDKYPKPDFEMEITDEHAFAAGRYPDNENCLIATALKSNPANYSVFAYTRDFQFNDTCYVMDDFSYEKISEAYKHNGRNLQKPLNFTPFILRANFFQAKSDRF